MAAPSSQLTTRRALNLLLLAAARRLTSGSFTLVISKDVPDMTTILERLAALETQISNLVDAKGLATRVDALRTRVDDIEAEIGTDAEPATLAAPTAAPGKVAAMGTLPGDLGPS